LDRDRAHEINKELHDGEVCYAKCPLCGAIVEVCWGEGEHTGVCQRCGIEFVTPTYWRKARV
jgi:uncharacterized paraquat-inducible protein A